MTNEIDHRGRTALVTGASSGIGAAFARTLAARGSTVVLVARREAELTRLATELHRAHGVATHVVVADLSAPDAAEQVAAAVADLGLEVDVLVNNAGFSAYGPFVAADPRRDRDMITVGTTAYVGLTHQFLPAMVARGDGVVVNVSSAGAFQALPYQLVYSATKAFVQAFTEGLWAENRGSGVRITAVCPAAVDTEYFQVLGGHEEAAFGRPISPDRVVEAALDAVDRDRMYTVVGLRWKVTVWSLRLFTRRRNALTYERLSRPRVRAAA
ncbi:SDR family oxidoreductase [Modestobacter sp. L9-4]|uniref:SDR family NAD(P)-dependent oxidoreductase n=1 Tax=Modestobacter sp. L9-4 TaxID=2851567 RepID=UPI001C752E99|nr:SDR family oxidoreductase [Modestobacter sp. L9-4]QXG76076.1 SDR family oxidoreductase [Modestobacter sp. L9-4]